MQKLYKLVRAMFVIALLFTQNSLNAQKCCVECQADVKVVSDNQVLLEKIEIKEGTVATSLNTNLYVSYRSGNPQKFWANIAIATAGVAVSTQLSSSSPMTAGDSKAQSGISPLVPLGVSVATLPSIWKNRPRSVPQAGLYVQYRDKSGNLVVTWEQPVSEEAKNSAELLTVNIDKPLSAGTLEVYLQNGSKNDVYYWGLQTVKNIAIDDKQIAKTALPKPNIPNNYTSCPGGYILIDGDCVVAVAVDENDPYYGTNHAPTPPWGSGGNPNGTNNNSGGGGSNGNEEQDRLNRCSSVYNVWALSVEGIKQSHKNASIACAAGIGIVDAVAAAATYENGGKFSKGPWAALIWSLSLFNKLDEMYNCLREADEKKAIALDILWNNYQDQRRENRCD
jgi:hypothetical protein